MQVSDKTTIPTLMTQCLITEKNRSPPPLYFSASVCRGIFIYLFDIVINTTTDPPPPPAQIRQKSRLTSVDFNLKNGVFRGWNKIISDVYSCSFRALRKYEKTIGSRVWCHDTLKSDKTVFIVWISLKITKFESWESWDLVSYQK